MAGSATSCWPRRVGKTAGTHLAAYIALAPTIRHALPRPPGATLISSSSSRLENHHHAYPDGMLDHDLEIVAYAVKLRQSYLLPAGVTQRHRRPRPKPGPQAQPGPAATSARLRSICTSARRRRHLASWHGPLRKPYRFRYRGARYRLHSAATGTAPRTSSIGTSSTGSAAIRPLGRAALYVLAGQYEHAGTLGELVVQADQASVARNSAAIPAKALAAPETCAATQIADGLRYLLWEEFR